MPAVTDQLPPLPMPSVRLEEVLSTLRVVAIPMRVPFRGITVREAALIEGPSGWGEFAPFAEYSTAECAPWLASALEAAYGIWPAPRRERIAINATCPAVPADEVDAVLARFEGCTTAKVKVAQQGQDLADDVARVARVRQLLGPAGKVRVDANGAWSVAQARAALRALAEFELEYAEQPCASVPELVQLRAQLREDGVAVAIAADESIRRASDPFEVARQAAADIIVVKVAPLGGVGRALAIVEQVGLPAVVSSAVDTSVGISAGLALAAALPTLEYACGLGTVELLTGDVTSAPLVPHDGQLSPRRVVPAGDFGGFAAAQDRRDWWRQRVRDSWRELASQAGEKR